MKDFYLDVYSIPSIDYFNKINKGYPFSIEENKLLFQEVYESLSGLENNYDKNSDDRKVLNIIKLNLIVNISNFIRLSRVKDDLIEYNTIFSSEEEFKRKSGPRILGGSYISDFFDENKIPKIDVFLRGFFYNKRKELLKKVFFTLSSLFKKDYVAVYNGNSWTKKHLENTNQNTLRVFNSFFWPLNLDPSITEYTDNKNKVGENLSNNIFKTIKEGFFKEIDNETLRRLKKLIDEIIYKVYFDYINCKKYVKNKKIPFKELHTGTCGAYSTRIIVQILKDKGVKIHSYLHTGGIGYMNYQFDRRIYIEYEIPDYLYIFNKNDIPILKNAIAKIRDDLNLEFKVMSLNNKKKIQNISNDKLSKSNKIINITYIDPKFNGGIQPFGMADDVEEIIFQNDLFSFLEKDYNLQFKCHPKGSKKNFNILKEKFPNIKIFENKSMDEIINEDTDIFIFRMIDSTAFNEVLFSNKPAIIIGNSQIELLTEEAKDLIKNRVSFVDYKYENNLLLIDKKQLNAALNKEYIMDFDFANRFQ